MKKLIIYDHQQDILDRIKNKHFERTILKSGVSRTTTRALNAIIDLSRPLTQGENNGQWNITTRPR